MCLQLAILSPHHFVNNTNIALNDLDHFIANIYIFIIWNRNSSPTRLISHHISCDIHRLQ